MVEGDTDVVQLNFCHGQAGPQVEYLSKGGVEWPHRGIQLHHKRVDNNRLTVVGAGPRKAPWIMLPEFISACSRL